MFRGCAVSKTCRRCGKRVGLFKSIDTESGLCPTCIEATGVDISDPTALIRIAADRDEAGDHVEAIDALGRALGMMDPNEISIETALSMPVYLHRAGQPEDAWREFERLLNSSLLVYESDPATAAVEFCHIHNRMRTVSINEGNPDDAVRNGVFSYMWLFMALHHQDRFEELEAKTSEKNIAALLSKLLGGSDRMGAHSELTGIIHRHALTTPEIDFGVLDREIRETMADLAVSEPS